MITITINGQLIYLNPRQVVTIERHSDGRLTLELSSGKSLSVPAADGAESIYKKLRKAIAAH